MKAIILICVLLASLLFSFPSVIVARELLADRDASTGGTANHSNPKVSCGKPSDPRYSSCVGKPKPTKCGKKTAYGRCKPPQGT
ncbi:hypothetical protein I3842_03G018100 [Carya illinoinensis]|uniref:Uncharacterized protein n=1 Tax=Carya illinoinensis TaxID=32201 RepID=A0A922FG23_CARIL|nr:hypothetical protein I3842_03G018100 [Carya illinoinensis]